jgi:cell division protein FtsI (penicillin-binding protein 3)
MNDKRAAPALPNRTWLLMILFFTATGLLLWRAYYLQILNNDFLRNHGDARSLRTVTIPAHRGMITDRNNEPLAISTPVDSIWVTPRQVLKEEDKLPRLAQLLDMPEAELRQMLSDRLGREFLYLKRQVSPELAGSINDLAMNGVNLQREYKRYYPAGEVTSHLVGFTNVDDNGQEGIELAFDHWLRGSPGEKRVLKDRLGRVVRNVESLQPARPGKDLHLSIDRRVQYLAYRELKATVQRHGARSGTLVMLDAKTGEVMALAVQPAYNPNNRSGLKSANYRNRAVTDVFEPGSTLKPFTIAAALMSDLYDTGSRVATAPGYVRVSQHTIEDAGNYGTLDLAGIIRKSSNVGASKIALSLGPRPLWELYSDLGFGLPTGSGFPGESAGVLNSYQNWSEVELATISFGYGISMTTLHLAQAYAAIANDGVMQPVTMLRRDEPVSGRRIMPVRVARQVRGMLEGVVAEGGTGRRAAVPGYRIAGKTGTVHKSTRGGYAEDRYLALFAGMAPASDPDLVLVVVIDEPQGSHYYGGQVAAPVFARVMNGSLRLLNIAPDDLPSFRPRTLMAAQN